MVEEGRLLVYLCKYSQPSTTMKKFILMLFASLGLVFAVAPQSAVSAQGWPSQYQGVMLQGFYWDSFSDTKWTKLESQADELADYFNLVWIPQSANCGGTSMGYDDLYWFSNYNSSFGNEAQLRSLITTFNKKGIGTIADVVVNHRKNLTNWVDFPSETYKGKTYTMTSADICANDDGGATKTWATANGYSLSSNNDTGEDWSGMRDLDHNSSNVQTVVKAYLDFLLKDLGYVGFRYDMVKGYAGRFTGLYNDYAKPTYSVGEYWDGNASTVKNWLNATKVDGNITSAVFDFPFRYAVRDAANGGDWTKLANGGIATDAAYQRYAVTFVENHDTEYRSSTSQQDPIKKDTVAANAFMMAMPGTPCVFLKHWQDCKHDIKNMILVRNFVGINNQSRYSSYASNAKYYAVNTTGSKGALLAVVGTGANNYTATARWKLAVSGHHYAYYLEKTMETAWVDLPSGEYKYDQTATLRAISATDDARLVYTLDGTEPTASSKAVGNGTKITVPVGTKTLKVGLLIGSTVSGIVTRNYTIIEPEPFTPYSITVYVNTDNVGWNTVNFWTWGGDGSHAPANTSWPGDKVSAKTSIGGKNWFTKTYRINSADDFVNFVFSTGTGSPQTVDITDITKDTYFVISTTKEGTKHTVETVANPTGIDGVMSDPRPTAGNGKVYSVTGRLVRTVAPQSPLNTAVSGLPKGVYIVGGKKVVVR